MQKDELNTQRRKNLESEQENPDCPDCSNLDKRIVFMIQKRSVCRTCMKNHSTGDVD